MNHCRISRSTDGLMGKKTKNSREAASRTSSISTPLNLSLKSKPSQGKDSTKDEEATFPKPKIWEPNNPKNTNTIKRSEFQSVKDFIVLDVNNFEAKVVNSNKGKTTPKPDTPTNQYKDRDETIQNMTSRKNTPGYFFLKGI